MRNRRLPAPLNHPPVRKREVLVAITAAFAGLSPRVAVWRASPGLASVGWLTRRRRRAPTLLSRGLTKGGQQTLSTRALGSNGVRVRRLHEGFPTKPEPLLPGVPPARRFSCSQNEKDEARVVISLGGDATGTFMPPLAQGVFLHHARVDRSGTVSPAECSVPRSARQHVAPRRDKSETNSGGAFR
jgi:hypothetical protein